ncbi:MAG: tetratricopeptide repeat protein [Candidatus Electrothrix sp. ATG1]|nr:tetratricopeptide repeat protein [Candidatus Electrothrix sp. ATG1]MCI5208861.1 tetratricopeptide repeat protein [Candidatus Electrothrix sp. ATG2]
MSLDDIAWWFSDLIFNGSFPTTLHERLAGELVKARLMKASGRFDEALEVINKTLRRIPDYPEALLLKAQILWEGYADDRAAKTCLQQVLKIKKIKTEKDEAIYRWSENLLKEMRQERRAQRSRDRRDWNR